MLLDISLDDEAILLDELVSLEELLRLELFNEVVVSSLELSTTLLGLEEDSNSELKSLDVSIKELVELDETFTAQEDNDRAVNIVKIRINGTFFITLNIINKIN